MAGLRSGRQDRTLLLIVWGLTLVVLALGVLTLSPVLLIWGVIGLPGAILLTYVHLRDTGSARGRSRPRGRSRRSVAEQGGPGPDGPEPDGIEEVDGFEEESSR